MSKKAPASTQFVYISLLRFYWDFCHKYHLDPYHSSLPLFLKKFHDKQQSEQQQQAHQCALSQLISPKFQPNGPPAIHSSNREQAYKYLPIML
ncbi:MAG: hypothetical protein ACXW1Z_25920 [Methylobacter sp.]